MKYNVIFLSFSVSFMNALEFSVYRSFASLVKEASLVESILAKSYKHILGRVIGQVKCGKKQWLRRNTDELTQGKPAVSAWQGGLFPQRELDSV